MAIHASLLILVVSLINVPKCSADNSFPLKWKDPNGGYTINIDYSDEDLTLKITHDKGLVVIDLAKFPAQNISEKLRVNNLKLRGIIIRHCALSNGVSFGTLFKHLGIENEIRSFEGSNITPQEFSLDGRFSSGFEKVRKLTLSKNNITKLNESVFDSLTELTGLYLSENNITEVNPNVFKNLKKLELLDMSYNELKSLSEGMFDNQKQLTILDLSENKLTSLTRDVFRGLYSLKSLSLSGNVISLMDDIVRHLPRVEYISLGSGSMNVKYEISENQNQLKSLFVTDVNLVEGLHLSGLRELEIVSSKVINVSGLSNIEIVLMKNCELSKLNANSFQSLNSTNVLSLTSNNIGNLVDGLFNGLTTLVELRLSNNQLTKISELVFGELKKLIAIDLSNNILATIHPNAFVNNTRLTTINLRNNRLSFRDEKTPFMYVYNLESLNLSHNKLIRIPDLVKLNKLKEVKLANNTISSVKFREIRRYLISLSAEYKTNYTCEDSNTHIYLSGNPLKCDRDMSDFLSRTDQAQLASVFIRNCNNSHRLPYERTQCPSGCTCEEIYDMDLIPSNRITISCKGKNLTKLPEIQFMNVISIELDISNNSLIELPSIDSNLNVTFIQAKSNQISKIEIEKLPSTLRGLDLSHNQFRTIAPDVLLHLKNLTNLEIFFFKDNPLECYCSSEDTNQLIIFANESSSMTDLQGATCNELYDLSMGASENICRNKEIVISTSKEVVVISVTIVIIISVVIRFLFIKHQNFIKMWLYTHDWCLGSVDEEYVDREKVYDVFISYEHTDRLLAYRITHALEKCNIFKVCLHERDFLAGDRIEESVNNAVRNSRRTLVILSKYYIQSVWCEHEFHLAWNRCVAERRKLIIAVKDGNLGDVTDKTIRSYIETHTYIESSDDWFFERLINRLPHKRTIGNIFPIREFRAIPLDINETKF